MWPKKKKRDQGVPADDSLKVTPQDIVELRGRVRAAIEGALEDGQRVQEEGRTKIDKLNASKSPLPGEKE